MKNKCPVYTMREYFFIVETYMHNGGFHHMGGIRMRPETWVKLRREGLV